jgi:hypothetical protein
MDRPPILRDVGTPLPRLRMPADARVSAAIVGPHANVAHVVGLGSSPKVRPPIIGSIRIGMVDLLGRE